MAADTLATIVHLPSLAAELPEGWSISEGATVVAPSGARFAVQVDHLPSGAAGEQLGDRVEAALRVRAPTAGAFARDGRDDADVRTYTYLDEGGRRVGRFAARLHGSRFVVVTGDWVEGDEVAPTEMARLIDGVRLLERPVLRTHDGTTVTGRSSVATPPPDPRRLSELRRRWAVPVAEATTTSVGRWSPDELVVLAAVTGAETFPTVDVTALAALPAIAAQATVDTVTRSLLARRCIRADGHDAVELTEPLGSIVATATAPVVAVLVERREGGQVSTSWLGVTPERSVVIRVLPDGTREIEECPPEALPSAVLAAAGVAPDDPSGEPGAVDLAHPAEGTGVVSLVVAWRSGPVVEGATLTWLQRPDRAWYAVESDADGTTTTAVVPAPAAALAERLLDALLGN